MFRSLKFVCALFLFPVPWSPWRGLGPWKHETLEMPLTGLRKTTILFRLENWWLLPWSVWRVPPRSWVWQHHYFLSPATSPGVRHWNLWPIFSKLICQRLRTTLDSHQTLTKQGLGLALVLRTRSLFSSHCAARALSGICPCGLQVWIWLKPLILLNTVPYLKLCWNKVCQNHIAHYYGNFIRIKVVNCSRDTGFPFREVWDEEMS